METLNIRILTSFIKLTPEFCAFRHDMLAHDCFNRIDKKSDYWNCHLLESYIILCQVVFCGRMMIMMITIKYKVTIQSNYTTYYKWARNEKSSKGNVYNKREAQLSNFEVLWNMDQFTRVRLDFAQMKLVSQTSTSASFWIDEFAERAASSTEWSIRKS